MITWGKINPFLAFIVVSIITGLLLGIPVEQISKSVYKGLGDTLGSLVIIIVLGAMLGKLVAESGAAQKIASVMMNTFGLKNIKWALMVTGFVIGIPLFYNVGFVLIVPMIFSLIYRYKLPAMYVAIPMLAPLSVAHGFLPPHPSPTALVLQFNANMGLTLLYGIIVSIPTIIIAGPIFSRALHSIVSSPIDTFYAREMPEESLPSAGKSFLSSMLPVLLLMVTTIMLFVIKEDGILKKITVFLGEPAIVMLIAIIVATWLLGITMGKSMKAVMDIYGDAVKDVAMLVLIIGGAGILKQIFSDSGVSQEIGTALKGLNMPPLFLGWLIAAVIRVCLGSATIAGLTTASIVLPIMSSSNVDPNLMVLSIGAGSLMFSHVNDSGFWLFKEYFNLSIKDTLRSWSLMESIISVIGLGGVLLLDLVI